MTNPKHTEMSPEECCFFLRKYSFGSLISDDLQISNVPFILSHDNLVETHLAINNPQLKSLDDHECLLTVLGPHAFISTDSYVSKPAVPTWNYASVDIRGRSRLMTAAELESSLDTMLKNFQPKLMDDKLSLPDDFKQKLMAGITGVTIDVTQIKGKLKLGQHRSIQDQLGVFEGLKCTSQSGYANFAREWLRKFRPSILDDAEY
ncbi:FMN-binding negative transcriptional regulator [Carnimonas bestiolae]|uniref:FMN-binding negative transcriptional regulator n=1 Tax=Carnimonas bestiolae TaxID=3402172 RepID=UPI003EDB7384